MKLVSRTFDQLSTTELYKLLQARVAVFVVEQECPYQELDGSDYDALHVWYEDDDGGVAAYLRAFPKDGEPGTVQMGRVLTIQRGTGLGGKILKEGIAQIRERFHPQKIFIEAQVYAKGFYEREGFRVCSEEFLEDGIPHVGMELRF